MSNTCPRRIALLFAIWLRVTSWLTLVPNRFAILLRESPERTVYVRPLAELPPAAGFRPGACNATRASYAFVIKSRYVPCWALMPL